MDEDIIFDYSMWEGERKKKWVVKYIRSFKSIGMKIHASAPRTRLRLRRPNIIHLFARNTKHSNKPKWHI